MLTSPSTHDLQPLLAANRRYYTGLAGSANTDEADADLSIFRTRVASPALNGVLRVRDVPLGDAVAEARRRLDGRPWAWWVGPDSDQGTAEGLIAWGAQEITRQAIMAIDLGDTPAVDGPADLTIRTVTEAEDMADYVGTFAPLLGITRDLDLIVARELGFGYLDVVRRAAVVDGRIAGTCTLSLGTEVAALYCITTIPDLRQRGIATAMVGDALRIARSAGRRIVTLQASAAGARVYRQVGFETVSEYRVFSLAQQDER